MTVKKIIAWILGIIIVVVVLDIWQTGTFDESFVARTGDAFGEFFQAVLTFFKALGSSVNDTDVGTSPP